MIFSLILPPLHRVFISYDRVFPGWTRKPKFLYAIAMLIYTVPIGVVAGVYFGRADFNFRYSCGTVPVNHLSLAFIPLTTGLATLTVIGLVASVGYKHYTYWYIQSKSARRLRRERNFELICAIICHTLNPLLINIPCTVILFMANDRADMFETELQRDQIMALIDFLFFLNPIYDALCTIYWIKSYREVTIKIVRKITFRVWKAIEVLPPQVHL